MNLTDEQIIKALECCGDPKQTGCSRCAVAEECLSGDLDICKLVLDLINRQKAEIERLQKIIVGFMDEVGTWSNKYDVDISNIHKLPLLAKEDWNIKSKIKAEAIKEFAERLKDEFVQGVRVYNGYASVKDISRNIDNLVKEMVGE